MEWDEETCYLEHAGVRDIKMCPVQQKESEEKFYEVKVSHIDGDKLMKDVTIEKPVQTKLHETVGWNLPFSFPFFEEKMHSLAITDGGLVSPMETKNHKLDAPHATFIQLTGEIELTVTKGTGFYKELKCGILVFNYDKRMTDQIKLIICPDGTINIFFSLPQNHIIEDYLYLSHGIYDASDNVLDHAVAHLDPVTTDPALIRGNNNTLITFTPVSR